MLITQLWQPSAAYQMLQVVDLPPRLPPSPPPHADNTAVAACMAQQQHHMLLAVGSGHTNSSLLT